MGNLVWTPNSFSFQLCYRVIERHKSMTKRPPKLRLLFLLLFSGAAAVVVSTWPRGGQLSIQTCLPIGLFGEASEVIHGQRYWQTQLDDIRTRRIAAENWERDNAAMQERLASILTGIDEQLVNRKLWMDDLYRRYPEMAPRVADARAAQLRTEADAVERADNLQKVNELMRRAAINLQRCEAAAKSKIR